MNARPWTGRRLHLIGLGGAGMSAYAIAAMGLGATVTGSDRADSAYAQALRARGIDVAIGHAADNLPDGGDVEVVYSTAIPPDNPERVAASARGLRVLPRAELLGEIAAQRRVIAIAGAHGKTTTTAMVAFALRECGADPSWIVGGEVPALGANAGWGDGEWLAVEADESDRSFLALAPELAIVTNVELDHHVEFATLAALEEAYVEFVSHARTAIVTPGVAELARRGLSRDRVAVIDGVVDHLAVPGAHNASNAALALDALTRAGVERGAALAALRAFPGVGRRFERLGAGPSGAQIVDDYAHHPTEIAVTLATARGSDPARLVAVFQPHLFSRTEALAAEFAAALGAADVGYVCAIYPARERAEDFTGVDAELIAAPAGATVLPTLDAAERTLRAELRDGDLCVVMGAGDVTDLAHRLVA